MITMVAQMRVSPIRLVGPFLDDSGNQCGSFYIFEADSEDQVRQWLDVEPFVQKAFTAI